MFRNISLHLTYLLYLFTLDTYTMHDRKAPEDYTRSQLLNYAREIYNQGVLI